MWIRRSQSPLMIGVRRAATLAGVAVLVRVLYREAPALLRYFRISRM